MKPTRRSFLKAASLLGAAGSVAPLTVSFWSSPANAMVTDYKALVCVFLYGANDSANTVIPFASAEHQKYLTLRGGDIASGGVGIPLGRLTNTALTGNDWALNPALQRVARLYNVDKKCAVIANVGPLLEPTIKDAAGNLVKRGDPTQPARLPPKLRSHNDQQAFWQSFGTEGTTTGWGGRLGDVFVGDGSNPAANAVFTAISAAGAAVFLNGVSTVSYQVAPTGPVAMTAVRGTGAVFGMGNAAGHAAVKGLMSTTASTRMFERDLNTLRARSIDAEAVLSAKLTEVGDPVAPGRFQGSLGAQLRMVLRLIRAGKALGLKRQVFHVGLGGFDLHDGLVGYDAGGRPLAGTQEALLGEVDGALADFYEEAQSAGVGNEVTTFTGSDFGRTYTPNNDGSDHGWGGHHFVIGGSVDGGRIVGRMPMPDVADPAWLPRGVLLPGTSTQQLAFTLGRWLNVPSATLVPLLPGIENFGLKNLGFML